jgi:hypothetical protein
VLSNQDIPLTQLCKEQVSIIIFSQADRREGRDFETGQGSAGENKMITARMAVERQGIFCVVILSLLSYT